MMSGGTNDATREHARAAGLREDTVADRRDFCPPLQVESGRRERDSTFLRELDCVYERLCVCVLCCM